MIDTLIVGAGLTGLATAHHLQTTGQNYQVIEASGRLGGRIWSEAVAGSAPADRYDLGPSWYWPGQPRIEALIAELGVKTFAQHAQGRLVYEKDNGSIRRDFEFSTMAGANRIEGGMEALVTALGQRLDASRLRLGVRLVSLERTSLRLVAHVVVDGRPQRIEARRVVLALPPRLIADTIKFLPALPDADMARLGKVPTWMAGHAKLVAIYATPFWRDAGLSGDGISERGPLMEIHDASPRSLAQGALFGFLGLPPTQRRNREQEIKSAAIEQLTRMFGAPAANPVAILYRDWSTVPLTASAGDQEMMTNHPAYRPLPALPAPWADDVIVASTEVGRTSGGLLEGALEATATTVARLKTQYQLA